MGVDGNTQEISTVISATASMEISIGQSVIFHVCNGTINTLELESLDAI